MRERWLRVARRNLDIVPCRVRGDAIEILRVLHTTQAARWLVRRGI